MISSLIIWILTLPFAVSVGNIKIVQSPTSINVTEGQTAVLYCICEGHCGIGAFRWHRNGKGGPELSNITAEYRGRVIGPNTEQFDGKTGVSIQLVNVTVRDSATYYCTVEFVNLGEYYGQGTTLVVTAVSVGNVTVVQSPASINVTEGQTAVLYCTCEGHWGIGAFRWHSNGTGGPELSNITAEYRGRVIGPNREQIDGKTGASIQLVNVTVRDSATYYCKVEFANPGEYYGQGTTLIVTAVSVGNVTVVQSPASIHVTEGQTAVLYCMYEGHWGIGAFRWHRNGKGGPELSNSTAEYRGRVIGPNREQFDGKTGASIQLVNVTVRDSATYYCKVEFANPGEYYGQGTTLVVTAVKTGNQTQLLVLYIIAVAFVVTLFSAIITVISCRNKTKDKGDQGPRCRVDNQTNEAEKVQYSALIFNERKGRPRSSKDDENVAYSLVELQH